MSAFGYCAPTDENFQRAREKEEEGEMKTGDNDGRRDVDEGCGIGMNVNVCGWIGALAFAYYVRSRRASTKMGSAKEEGKGKG
jgi:hypothetical protein